MRWALGVGAIAAIAVAVLNWQHVLSNADFIYMCCSARLLADGGWPVSAYFPAGYPVMLWLLVQSGLSALSAGALLSALGTGLSAAAVTWTARRLKLPVILAVALGLLGATLPDVFEIAFNPHLDALYTGLGLWLIALALAILAGDKRRRLLLAILICAALLLTLRYHAVIAIVPIALVLAFYRHPARRAGAGLLVLAAVISVVNYGSLYLATGAAGNACCDQVRTGYIPRVVDFGDSGVFTEYERFLNESDQFSIGMAASNIRHNFPQYLSRKAVLAGLILWLLAALLRRYPWRSLWLVLFILGYALAVSAAYFTPRCSALPELAALLLVIQVLAMFISAGFSDDAATNIRWRLGFAGIAVVALLIICGAGYNAWREARLVTEWRRTYADVLAANRQALELAGGRREHLFGAMDYTAWPLSERFNLPGTTYSRFWLDDPRVSHIAARYIPRYQPAEILSGDAPVSVILLWERHGYQPGHPLELELINELERSWTWQEVISAVGGTRLWVRGN